MLNRRRFRTFTLLAVLVLILSLTSGLVRANQEPIGQFGETADNAYATCTETETTQVTCTLKVVANQSSLDLTTDLLPVAQQVNSGITADTVIWLQAWGGQGGKGETDGNGKGGNGGLGGFAQTITTINEYQATYGTTTLYYYFGECCKNVISETGDGGGAASSIVASVPHGFSTDNLLLIAGGGGGGNAAQNFKDGQAGGHGGSAIATTSQATYGPGQTLQTHDGITQGGSTNGPGAGGVSSNNEANGQAGYGGQGGGDKDSDGAKDVSFWENGNPNVGSAGAGNNADTGGSGGAGGGGYGGGAGAAPCGLSEETSHNCAGAGGGSYAVGSTQLDAYAPDFYIGGSLHSDIRIVFNLAPAAFSFATPVANPFDIVPEKEGYSAPVFADINGDILDDLFYGDQYGGIWYYENTGTYGNPSFIDPGQANPYGIATGDEGFSVPFFVDINNDQDLDLFYGDKGGGFWYQENTGDFLDPAFAARQANPFGIVPGDHGFSAPAFVDIDADGDQDFFYGNQEGGIWYQENTGSSTDPVFAARQANPFGIVLENEENSAPVFVDIDADGDQDLFYGDKNGGIWFQVNIGTSTNPAFGPPAGNPDGLFKKASGYTKPTAVDLTKDGYQDLFVGDAAGGFWYYQNNGPLSAEAPTANPVPRYQTTPGVEVRIADDASQLTAIVYGSESFDASQVNQDIVSLVDWSGNQLATVNQSFWGTALGDLNDDGYLDRTLTFHSNNPTLILHEASDGKELCVQGVTLDGVEFRGCTFVE